MSNLSYSRIVAVAALFVAGCAEGPRAPEDVGVLELPLSSVGSDGTRFMLEGTFQLVGPETLTKVAGFATDTLVTMNPRVGTYQLTVSPWRLARVITVDGVVRDTELVSGAILRNPEPQVVQILNGKTTTVTYQFAVPGAGMVTFSRGTLDVDFTVDEGFPAGTACTQAVECASHVCSLAGVCAAPTCTDGVLNGAETTPDCGGGCDCGADGGAVGPLADGGVVGPGSDAEIAYGSIGISCEGNPMGCGPGLQCIQTPGEDICQLEVTPATCAASTCAGTCVDANEDHQLDTCISDGSQGATCDDSPGSCATGLMCVSGFCRAPVASRTCFPSTCAGVCDDYDLDHRPDTCKAASLCLKINELAGGSETFVELQNRCPNDVVLDGVALYFGTGSPTTAVVDLPRGGVVPSFGYVVFGTAMFSRSAKDGTMPTLPTGTGWIATVDAKGAVHDSVGWGSPSTVFEAVPLAELPDGISGRSAARIPNGRDTQDNSADFHIVNTPTPRASNGF